MREAIKNYSQFKREMNAERRTHPRLDAVGEPHFYYLADPRARDFASRYAQDYRAARGALSRVLFVSVPEPERGRKLQAKDILIAILRELGDIAAEKREEINVKARRLHQALRSAGIEMLVFADIHNMVLAASRKPLLAEFYYLFFTLKNDVLPIHVLFTGEKDVSDELFFQEGTITRRIRYL